MDDEGTASKRQRRILVVDGNPHSREGMRASLSRENEYVDTASDGWDAIRKIKAASFDVAIIDLDLPPVRGMWVTGWDLVRIIRAFSPAVSIVLVSAEAGRPQETQASRLGISLLLEKPISLARLRAIVRGLESHVEAFPATCCPVCP